MYWMSAKIPSDQFLLYAFDGVPDLPRALAAVLAQASDCPELLLRVADAGYWSYPQWIRCVVDESAVVVHDGGSWTDCLDAAGALAADQLDPRHRAWRLHVLAGAYGIPGIKGAGTIVVLQISHALGDGIRASALAARLFGRDEPVPAAAPRRWGVPALPLLALRASAAHRALVRDTGARIVAESAGPWPARRSNDRPVEPVGLRTIVRPRSQLPGPTVTVGVLAAVAETLAAELAGATNLGAEVPMAKPGVRHANNHFGNVSVGLHPQLPFEARAERIAADLADRRQRAAHPAMAAADAAFAATPASLLRWGIGHFDPSARSPTVGGNTVVSSVNRGVADLQFGGCPVVLTAGYPALSPMMGLTHGVHGIGDTVAVSVHAGASAVPDLDAYMQRLAAALDGPR
jgi:Wax ester synthase-like Acyl-CoA acyltransferase domain/WS/DGAT C-terminal domain